MNYGEYKIHAEYESTGIKKLIKLYAYLKKWFKVQFYLLMSLIRILHDV